MSNVKYIFSEDGKTAYGLLPNGSHFTVDADMVARIIDVNLYVCCKNSKGKEQVYLMDRYGNSLHNLLFPHKDGYEIDHINLDTFDNRRSNIRYCTHQQNQINQPVQRNNTSGVSGVSWYAPRKKYRARIKIGQQEIHLGYYGTFQEAVQARNVGMECMFGEYGRYNDVPPSPDWIRRQVIEKCKRFAELSVCRTFLLEESA